MKNNQVKSGVVISYISQAIHILTALIYTPIMLRIMGKSEYGLYQLVASTVSYLSVLNLGFNSAYIRFFSRYKVQEDKEGEAKLNGLFIIIFSIIALVCILCGVIMEINIEALFGGGLTKTEIEKAKILMGFLIMNMALSFIGSVFEAQMSAYNRFFPLKMVELLYSIFNPFLALPLLLLGYGSVGIVTVTTSLMLCKGIIDFIYIRKNLNVKFCFRDINFHLLREMSGFTFFIFLNMIIEQINWNIDKFLLGRIKGTTAVAVYSIGGQIISIYRQIAGVIRGMFIPRINTMVAENDSDLQICDLFIKLARIIFMIAYLIFSGFVLWGQEFIKIWAGNGYDRAYMVGIVVMFPLLVPLIQGLGIDIQRAKNKHQVRSVVYFIIALMNLGISVPLIYKWGEVGAAIGTAIALFLGQGVFMNVYYHKGLNLDMLKFWKNIAGFVPSICITLIGGIIIKMLVRPANAIILFIDIGLYVICYVCIFFILSMNREEKNLVRSLFKWRKVL